MTDRELLEMAAKAAGMNGHRYCEPWRGMAAYTPQDGYFGPTWNPLTDDGDALRLAVSLGMNIDVGAKPVGFTEASVIRDSMRIGAEEYHDGDPYSAARRAIVRAAAAIGAGMAERLQQ